MNANFLFFLNEIAKTMSSQILNPIIVPRVAASIKMLTINKVVIIADAKRMLFLVWYCLIMNNIKAGIQTLNTAPALFINPMGE